MNVPRNGVKLEIYLVIDRIQALPRNLDLVRTRFEPTNRLIIHHRLSIIEHCLFIEVLLIDPLQWSHGRMSLGGAAMTTFDLEFETGIHVTNRVYQDSLARVTIRA